ncbi:RCC1 domain-containing protein [Bdellovibrio bacteriovorus]|uniref:RCC1 domain-containing protein n=1 Tax=Bdellovibrio bacteriovorus TaxID=959 RepID=UPI003AA9BFE9
MKKHHVILIMALWALTACDRLSLDESSKVKITFPSTQTLSSKVEAMTSSGSTRPVPTGFTGDRPINCYIIGASGPEAAMRRNVCTRDDGSMTPKFIGEWVGGVPAGGSISMDVTSGKDRVITVVGFYAPEGTCKDFKGTSGPGDALSQPYILGEVGKLLLVAGEEKKIDIDITFDPEKWFDSCDGPDFPDDGPGGGGSVIPTILAIQKDYFPPNTLTTYSCSSFGVALRDAQNRQGSLATDTVFSVSANGAPLEIYPSFNECQQNVGAYGTAVIPAGQSFKDIVVKAPDTPGALLIATSIVSSSAVLSTPTANFQNVGSGDKGFDLVGARSILPDLCYPFTIKRRYVTGTDEYSSLPATITLAPSSGLTVYSDSNCTTAITAATIAAHTYGTNVFLKMTGAQGQNSLTMSGSGYLSLTQSVYRGGGTNVPWGFEVRGHRDGPSRGQCYNSAYEAVLVNSQHTAVMAPSQMPVTLSPGNTEFYTESSCMTTASPNMTLFGGQYSLPFYIKTLQPVSLPLSATAPGLTSGVYNINVRGPLAMGAENINVSAFNGACAKVPYGTFCWGNDNGGRIRNGASNIPAYVNPAGADWSYIKMGADFACGLSMAGDIKCWGQNAQGQVGNGTTATVTYPEALAGGDYYMQMSVGNMHACAITNSNVLKCWGSNSAGQIGDGTTTYRSTPVIVDAGTNYRFVSAAASHTCAITTADQLKCWGNNLGGKLGNGSTTSSLSPVLIDSGVQYATVSAGSTSTCGITTSNALKCWGENSFGNVGNGTNGNNVTTPANVDVATTYTSISVGEQMACGIGDGLVKCWGLNSNGRLGLGGAAGDQSIPTPVSMPSAWGTPTQVSTGSGTTCATTSSRVACWGEGLQGELGVNTPMNSNVPMELIY